MFFCYKITNKINGKVYIGQAKRPKSRWNAHKSRAFNPKSERYDHPLSRAIRKYGIDNFSFDILASVSTEREVNEQEVFYVAQYRSNINRFGKSFGYNLTDGGSGNNGWNHKEETCKKISESHKGVPLSAAHRQKIGEGHKGITHSVETKEKIRQLRFGTKHSETSKIKMSNSHLGLKFSAETITKISGENSHRAKLNWLLVNQIRSEYLQNDITMTQLANRYSVSYTTIQSIISNKSWRI